MKLNYTRLTYIYQALEALKLPDFPGSTFRGVFGHALKQTVCVEPHGICDACRLKNICLYQHIFESKLSSHEPVPFPGLNEIPHPYLIQPSAHSPGNDPEHLEIAISLTLLGPAIAWQTTLFKAMALIGQIGMGKGQSPLVLIEVRDTATHELVFDQGAGWLVAPPVYELGLLDTGLPQDLKLDFITPLRLPKHGNDPDTITPEIIIRQLLRRFQTLVFYYGENFSKVDMKVLVQDISQLTYRADLHFEQRFRYSNRQQKKIPIHGFAGSIELRNASPFIQALFMVGEVINIGKGAAMGLGNYKIIKTV